MQSLGTSAKDSPSKQTEYLIIHLGNHLKFKNNEEILETASQKKA